MGSGEKRAGVSSSPAAAQEAIREKSAQLEAVSSLLKSYQIHAHSQSLRGAKLKCTTMYSRIGRTWCSLFLIAKAAGIWLQGSGRHESCRGSQSFRSWCRWKAGR